jgi:prevent-host-death family protein
MKIWPVQDAKAKFSEMLETCVSSGPQLVSRRGTVAAVLVPIAEWERLNTARQPTLKELLLSDEGRFDLEIPPRGRMRRRPPIKF